VKKKVTIALTSLFLLLSAFVVWFYYEAMRSPVGPPNPAIDASAVCSIQKDNKGIYTVLCSHNTMQGAPLYVAKSNENLDKYLGKKVSIQANYLPNKSNIDTIETNTQCIENKCQQIFGDKNQKTYAIVIEKIKEL